MCRPSRAPSHAFDRARPAGAWRRGVCAECCAEQGLDGACPRSRALRLLPLAACERVTDPRHPPPHKHHTWRRSSPNTCTNTCTNTPAAYHRASCRCVLMSQVPELRMRMLSAHLKHRGCVGAVDVCCVPVFSCCVSHFSMRCYQSNVDRLLGSPGYRLPATVSFSKAGVWRCWGMHKHDTHLHAQTRAGAHARD
jgi:hypothetical protein